MRLMRRFLSVLALTFLLVNHATADQFIVTKKGQGIWASTVSKDGDVITYVNRTTKKRLTINTSMLDAVIPVPRRGFEYPEADVKRFVRRIQKAKAKHHRLLYGPLNKLEADWTAFLTSSDEQSGAADEIVKAFMESDRLPDACKRTVFRLQLSKSKNQTGSLAKVLDAHITAIKAECVATTKAYLKLQAEATKMSVKEFVFVHSTGRKVKRFGDAELKQTVDSLVEQCRTVAYKTSTSAAIQAFMKGKSVASYLDAMAILYETRDQLASTDLQKADIQKRIATMIRNTGRFLRQYNFDRMGCPMTSKDVQKLTAAQTSLLPIGDNGEAECILFPTETVAPVATGTAFEVPLCAVFNRAQPADARYRLHVGVGGDPQNYTHDIELGAITLKNGHWEYTLKEDFAGLPDGFTLGTDDNGIPRTYRMYGYTLHRYDPDPEPGDPEWPRISGYGLVAVTAPPAGAGDAGNDADNNVNREKSGQTGRKSN